MLGQGDPGLKEMIQEVLRGPSRGQNIKYDLCCVAGTWPDLLPLIFEALDEGRIHDTRVNEQIHLLGTLGDVEGGVSTHLAELARRWLGLDVDFLKADDGYRLRFGEFRGMRAEDYPEGALDYSKLDAEITWNVAQEQPYYPSQELHVAAAFALYRMTVRGLRVDKKFKEALQRKVEKEVSPESLPLIYQSGLVIPAMGPQPYANGAKAHALVCPRKKGCACPVKLTGPSPERVAEKDVLFPLIENICRDNGLDIPRTPKGGIKADADTIAALAVFSPVLGQFGTREGLNKLRTSYFPQMEWPYGSGRTADRIHFDYKEMANTSRARCGGTTKKNKDRAVYPAVNIQQADPRVRPAYVPEPGWIFAIADYNAIDLCSLAQTIKDLYGPNELLDQINAGLDPHTVLAGDLMRDIDPAWARGKSTDEELYEGFKALKKSDPETHKRVRFLAKTVGLGYAGGMGLNVMVKTCATNGFVITKIDARRYKRLWLRRYPAMDRYLGQWVPQQRSGEWHSYSSPMGTRRVRCSFTECANGRALQTPAAEGMKIAHFMVERAASDRTQGDVLFGAKPVIQMHDELVVMVRDDRRTRSAQAKRLGELMVIGMNVVLPDVWIKANPALSPLWTKEGSEPVLGPDGEILVYGRDS